MEDYFNHIKGFRSNKFSNINFDTGLFINNQNINIDYYIKTLLRKTIREKLICLSDIGNIREDELIYSIDEVIYYIQTSAEKYKMIDHKIYQKIRMEYTSQPMNDDFIISETDNLLLFDSFIYDYEIDFSMSCLRLYSEFENLRFFTIVSEELKMPVDDNKRKKMINHKKLKEILNV